MPASSKRQHPSQDLSLHVELSTLGADDLRRRTTRLGIDAFGLSAEEMRTAIVDASRQSSPPGFLRSLGTTHVREHAHA